MKKVFASIVVAGVLALGATAVAAEEAVLDDDMLIVEEIQGDVMPISEVLEEDAVAVEVTEEETEAAEADKEATEETTTEAAEAEEVVIDFAAIEKHTIVINDEKVALAGGMGVLVEKDGVIFVPVRAALEAVGYQVSWADKEQMVMGANQSTGAMFIMQLENTLLFYLTAEGEEGKLTMEAAPFKNEEEWRTYVPLKALADALGYKIGVDEDETDVVVTLSK